MKTDITHGSAFLALGFPEPEASNLQTRSELVIEIQSIIEAEALTQKEAAVRFGTSQPRISALLKGRVDKFTVDALMNMLSHAGTPVAVVTKDKILALPATTTRRKVLNAIFPRNRR